MQPPAPRAGVRHAWNAAALAFAGLICALTLSPATSPGAPTALADESPRVADGLRNLVLMAPLAVALVLAGRRKRIAWLLCSALSAAVELAQTAIPGRIAGLNDLAANSLGAALAIGAIATRARWTSPPRFARIGLDVLAVILPVASVFVTAALLRPVLPQGTWYGGWNFTVEGMDRFAGPVVSARIGAAEIPAAGPSSDSAALRSALERGEEIRVRWGPGARPARIAPIALVIGPEGEEVLLVGARGADLVIRRWRQSARLQLEQPEWVWMGAFTGAAVTEGAELSVAPSSAARIELALRGENRTALELGPGRAWALLAPDHWVAAGFRGWLDALWIALVFLPLGVWLPRSPAALPLALLAMAGLGLASKCAELAPAGLAEYAGALAGVAAGAAFSRSVRAGLSVPAAR